jgi:alkaline phosphatase
MPLRVTFHSLEVDAEVRNRAAQLAAQSIASNAGRGFVLVTSDHAHSALWRMRTAMPGI